MSRKRAAQNSSESSSDLEDYVDDQVLTVNKADASGGKGKLKAGTFAGMGLMPSLLKALTKLGYRQPTPIQRKTIPALLEGKDVVAMARTGSGKTAAFGLACLQRLREHSPVVGARALILCPNRELALQTGAVLKKLAVGTDLRFVSLIGGDDLSEQFTSLAANPDCLIVTPGRLAHMLAETGFSILNRVEFVVFDEADRLLEDASLAEQCRTILSRLPPPGQRQTALFSATLPSALVELAQAGLVEPQLIRLDAETKLSPDLEMIFLGVKTQSRDSMLLMLLDELKKSVSQASAFPLTCLFVPTKHHVDWHCSLIKGLTGIACAGIHGSMDQQARAISIARFRSGEIRLLVVTDVAARGLDIPLLDSVINYTFPASPKLFVHRVGRVARAGRAGRAWSFVSNDELPLLVEVSLFLSRNLRVASTPGSLINELCLGGVEQQSLDDQQERIDGFLSHDGLAASEAKVASNAMRMYLKTRTTASPESYRRAKELLTEYPVWPPHFAISQSNGVGDAHAMLAALKSFKPKQSHIELPKLNLKQAAGKESQPASNKSSDFRLEYRPADDKAAEERGYSLHSFAKQARSLAMDINQADDTLTKFKKALKKQKERADQKHIAGEYERWQSRTKMAIGRAGEEESREQVERASNALQRLQQRGQWRGGKPQKSVKKRQ